MDFNQWKIKGEDSMYDLKHLIYALIIIIAVILVAIIGMKYSSEILGPILLSVFISIIIYPFLMWLKKKGLSYNQSIM